MFGWPFDLALGALVFAMLGVFGRLVRGPSLPDRVVALDLIATLTIGVLAVFAAATRRTTYLDIAVAFALVAFLATVAMARYAERSADASDERE